MQDSTQTYIILRQYINSSLYAVRTPTSCSTTTTTKTQHDQKQDLKIRRLKEQCSSTLLTNDLRHPEENRLFKGSKPSPSHPSEKESSIKMIMQHQSHNYDRRKLSCAERCLSCAERYLSCAERYLSCARLVPCITNLTQTGLGLNRGCSGDRPTACLPA
jgi:hypothetical protein